MRVAFLVDGFNLYHSIRDAEKQFAGRPQRWLDLRAFCQDYVRHFGRNAVVEGVYYFSALAKHLQASNPGVVLRHEAYIDAITSTGVQVTLANFKARDKYIPFEHCTFRVRWFKRPIRLPIRGCTVMFQRAPILQNPQGTIRQAPAARPRGAAERPHRRQTGAVVAGRKKPAPRRCSAGPGCVTSPCPRRRWAGRGGCPGRERAGRARRGAPESA